MPVVVPEPGLVIPYIYLWRREHEAGEESGRKTRPCLIVVVVPRAAGKFRVAVVPITSRQPDMSRSSVELPRRIICHLGLDAARSWVICDEYNEFEWPGVDLAIAPRAGVVFKYVPDALLKRVRSEVLDARKRGALKAVSRTE